MDKYGLGRYVYIAEINDALNTIATIVKAHQPTELMEYLIKYLLNHRDSIESSLNDVYGLRRE